MTTPHSDAKPSKVVPALPAPLRQELRLRAAALGVDSHQAIAQAISAWQSATTALPREDTGGAVSFTVLLPPGVYAVFSTDCATRGVSATQGLAQAVRLWLNLNQEDDRSTAATPAHSSRSSRDSRSPAHTRRLVVCNQKGGVGKTATGSGLAQALAERGQRVLLVDYDPQGHLSNQLGVPLIEDGEESLARQMCGEARRPVEELVTAIGEPRFDGRLWLLPACLDAFLLDVRLSQTRARELALERALQPLEQRFDAVVVDCPPSLGLSVDAALYYARSRAGEPPGNSGVVVPVQAEDASATAYRMLDDQIDDLSEDMEVSIAVLGLVVNLYDARRGFIATSSLEKWKALGDPPVLAVVPDRKEQREAVRLHRPLLAYSPECEQAFALRELARRLG